MTALATMPAASGCRRWATAASALALGPQGRERDRNRNALMSMVSYVVCALLFLYAAHAGVIATRPAIGIAALMTVGSVFFYLLLRSGATRHLRDPAVPVPQLLFAIGVVSVGYPIAGDLRGLALLIAGLVSVLGVVSLTGWQTVGMVLLQLAALAATMALFSVGPEARFDPRVEVVHLLIGAICLPALALLGQQLRAMGLKASAQKRELVEVLRRVESMARHDELTGLCNRRHMLELMSAHAERCARFDEPFSVCLIDLDHFKLINDNHGHAAGDAVLRTFAAHLRQCLRDVDVAARWGGEEFMLLLPNADATAASAALERLRKRAAQEPVGPGGVWVRFSAGLAVHRGSEPLPQLIERADAAMYRAKALGRDRTAIG